MYPKMALREFPHESVQQALWRGQNAAIRRPFGSDLIDLTHEGKRVLAKPQ
jgi:hypothetical protein